ncbi:MAG: hypothetical protein H6810_13160 [Phycisphaeraceae bacterium]|nr:MAG: hypothetical protein H6810_13160 [Phycisphaeraceae bacterium]
MRTPCDEDKVSAADALAPATLVRVSGSHGGHACACVLMCLLALAGCVETRVIPANKPFMSGLPGTQGGAFRLPAQSAADNNPLAAKPGELRTTNPDGTVTLRSPTVRDLMRHILETIMADDQGAFTRDLLSDETRREFAERGYDPGEAFKELKRRREDIRRLFQAMPAGEFTPGVMMKPIGRNMFRLHAGGDPTMQWTFMDVVFDRGDYKLRWFGR